LSQPDPKSNILTAKFAGLTVAIPEETQLQFPKKFNPSVLVVNAFPA